MVFKHHLQYTLITFLISISQVHSQIRTFKISPTILPILDIIIPFPCGTLNDICCEPTFRTPPPASLGPLVKCNAGLGCDLLTKKCISPCGVPGGPCCDGPETKAIAWNKNGYFSPTGWGLQEMCQAGTCDKRTHRCVACSSAPGTACCPPSASQTTAKCIGENLECRYDEGTNGESGVCFRCGGVGNAPCQGECEYPLRLSNGVCVECGGENQIACINRQYECNSGCKPHFKVVNGVCKACGELGQIECGSHDRSTRACANYVDWDHCKPGLGVLNGLCQYCGTEGKIACTGGVCVPGLKTKNGICTSNCGRQDQAPCDDGTCSHPFQVILSVCRSCGVQNRPPCPAGGCRSPLKPNKGLCINCGSEGEVPCNGKCDEPGAGLRQGLCSALCGTDGWPRCDNGCRQFLTEDRNGQCRDQRSCAREGEACVIISPAPNGGLACCIEGGQFLCENGFCKYIRNDF